VKRWHRGGKVKEDAVERGGAPPGGNRNGHIARKVEGDIRSCTLATPRAVGQPSLAMVTVDAPRHASISRSAI
jgi:hypothetical protein